MCWLMGLLMNDVGSWPSKQLSPILVPQAEQLWGPIVTNCARKWRGVDTYTSRHCGNWDIPHRTVGHVKEMV